MEVTMDIDVKCSSFGKEKIKNKNRLMANVYVIGSFLFCTQDTTEGVSDLGLIAVL
jgi:pentose-5-phosphate-3-epimerase